LHNTGNVSHATELLWVKIVNFIACVFYHKKEYKHTHTQTPRVRDITAVEDPQHTHTHTHTQERKKQETEKTPPHVQNSWLLLFPTDHLRIAILKRLKIEKDQRDGQFGELSAQD
jgi:hypothetical protein